MAARLRCLFFGVIYIFGNLVFGDSTLIYLKLNEIFCWNEMHRHRDCGEEENVSDNNFRRRLGQKKGDERFGESVNFVAHADQNRSRYRQVQKIGAGK